MKKQAYTVIAMFVLVGSMAVAAQAQTSGHAHLIANIPFEFTAAGKTLPAGEYTVTAINNNTDHPVLRLSSKDGKSGVLISTMPVIGKARDNARLVFNHYQNQYFFAQAWVDGEGLGLQAPKPRLGRELAGMKPTTESVALTSRR